MSDIAYIIRGVLIQVAEARLLLPNATIAEVLSYAAPEPLENAPDWLLGRIRWRGWQLPLMSFARFAGIDVCVYDDAWVERELGVAPERLRRILGEDIPAELAVAA